ncbi:MAG: hypothetical protein ACI9H6_000873 [Patiriisocius sp.]|jgi:hypothetical protein
MNKILIAIIVLLAIGGGVFLFLNTNGSKSDYKAEPDVVEQQVAQEQEMIPVEADGGIGDGAESLDEILMDETMTVIGTSVEGRDITAYHYGEGDKEVLFIGGIHGGYSWNAALLGHQLVSHFDASDGDIPDNVKVTVIPVLNPDGLHSVVGTADVFSPSDVPASESTRIAGRFNANDVDLNRNFDCQWEEEGVWKNQSVSGGDNAFSEPESQAIREYVATHDLDAVVTYYSAAGGVYASQCDGATLSETRELTNVYADASGYSAHEEFDFYEVTGDMVNWLASQNIPAISVLLTTHNDTESKRNIDGVEAVLKHIAE